MFESESTSDGLFQLDQAGEQADGMLADVYQRRLRTWVALRKERTKQGLGGLLPVQQKETQVKRCTLNPKP